MRVTLLLFISLIILPAVHAQFAPQAGLPGSTAVYYTSSDIAGWATGCTIRRGYLDIAMPDSGYVTQGDSSLAIGIADNFIVSLGDSGVATLTFAQPIMDGAGADFLIYENGFRNPADSEEAFLELAFVEVSSDGVNYVRFPATSVTQTDTQIAGAGMYLDARSVNNLAGKYVGKWGTPFDLQDLPDDSFLDPGHITHVRLVDVVGSIGAYGGNDNQGRRINDPYPTHFPTGGFDLDAVAVLHQATSVYGVEDTGYTFTVSPNPAKDYIHITTQKYLELLYYKIVDVTGRIVQEDRIETNQNIVIQSLPQGHYTLTICSKEGASCTRRFIRY